MKKIFAKAFLSGMVLGTGVFISVQAHAVGFGNLFGSMLGQSGSQHMGVDETLVKMSERMNRTMPQAVDTDTRLDKVSAESGNQIAYHYTILKVQSKDINPVTFNKTFRSSLQKRVCAADDLKLFFRNRITVAYAYRGADGGNIGKLAFSPKDCGYPT